MKKDGVGKAFRWPSQKQSLGLMADAESDAIQRLSVRSSTNALKSEYHLYIDCVTARKERHTFLLKNSWYKCCPSPKTAQSSWHQSTMPKSISVSKAEGKPGQVYHPLSLDDVPKASPEGTQVAIKMHAAALNHRDLFIRQSLYPAIGFGVPLLADGCGTVVEVGPQADQSWQGKRVVVNPGSGWTDSLEGPEDKGGYKILGGTKVNANGTLQEYMIIDQAELEEAPAHLSSVEAAAIPLTGLTAWRAVMVKCGEHNLRPGKNVLVTGIGGGVALMALEFARVAGANVWVTSSSEEKIKKAVELGAKGGVNYKDKAWEKKLLEMLPADNKLIDAVVDGAGSDVVEKGARIVKVSSIYPALVALLTRVQAGGIISIYGMTVSPKMPFLMQAVLKNIEVKGSTMGSRKEFKDMMDFIKTKKAQPSVSRVVQGLDLDAINTLFDDMKQASQFGKLVVEISKEGRESKL